MQQMGMQQIEEKPLIFKEGEEKKERSGFELVECLRKWGILCEKEITPPT